MPFPWLIRLFTIPSFLCLFWYPFASIELGSGHFPGDYSPPFPPPPSLPPLPPPSPCEGDLKGFGFLDTLCVINSSLDLADDVYVYGNGSLEIGSGVIISCPFAGCSIYVNMSGRFVLGAKAVIVAGSVWVEAGNASLLEGSVINVSAFGGEPPGESSGTPEGVYGAGGGYGGRGASCLVRDEEFGNEVWGGDAYGWSELDKPWSYGSKGGTTTKEKDFGGGGGGRIKINVTEWIDARGTLLADGGDGGFMGGGGSGGSIFIKAHKMTGDTWISASGGDGYAGGSGGRVAIDVFSRRDVQKFFVHGGKSFGCPKNSGAAGTFYDAVPRRLVVCNHNMSTETDTLLLEFPNQPLWTNIYIENQGKAVLPLLWSRVQVQGQLSLSCGAVLTFGLARYPSSVFELMAEELLMSNSKIKVYGALRMSVKMHLMLNSEIHIHGVNDAINDAVVATSLLEVSNLLVLKDSSTIQSSGNLGVHGQGYLNLSGPGNLIEAERIVLSLYYSVNVGVGSELQSLLRPSSSDDAMTQLCEIRSCPLELVHPPEDCTVNSTLAFTLQICRVEEFNVEGTVKGSVVHFHLVRSVVVLPSGAISVTGLGCSQGIGRGKLLSSGLGGGGGYGGKGGAGYYDNDFVGGGIAYGNVDLPCELGSGSGNDSLPGSTKGGGIVGKVMLAKLPIQVDQVNAAYIIGREMMGSMEHPLPNLLVEGSLTANGESFEDALSKQGGLAPSIGPGGGSGGTILLFVKALALGNFSIISSIGGIGSPNGGGGGGGGRIHFHWSDIRAGNGYQAIANVNGTVLVSGGLSGGRGQMGQEGTITGKTCPEGLYGIFCEECPVGTYKNVSGSDRNLCSICPAYALPHRAVYNHVPGGATEANCPYKCISDRYHMPECYTTIEELVYTFGGPWLFGFFLLDILIILALVLSVARMRFVATEESPELHPQCSTQMDKSLPFLRSLDEELNIEKERKWKNQVHRLYFLGPNTFRKPWQLPHSPPDQVKDLVYEDAFNRFVDEVNGVASYHWWEGSIYVIISPVAYPLAWSWLQWRRRKKLQQLQEFVHSEYDHSCLRSCRCRALYEGLKIGATSDLMLAYLDFYLGEDEKRSDDLCLHHRYPVSLAFGGDGTYMAPYFFHNDYILTRLLEEVSVSSTVWYRFVAGLNAQLRLVRRGQTFAAIISWLETHGNPTLSAYGVQVDLAGFHRTATSFSHFGLVMHAAEAVSVKVVGESKCRCSKSKQQLRSICSANGAGHFKDPERPPLQRKSSVVILNSKHIEEIKDEKFTYRVMALFIHHVIPTGRQDLVGLGLCTLLLGDFSLVLLTLTQLYTSSIVDFLLVLFILPLGIILPFPAGINALFCQNAKKSVGLARIHAIWNIISLANVVTALVCGYVHYESLPRSKSLEFNSWNFRRDESEWWLLPCSLIVCKILQARFINYHIANLEIRDHSLYSDDADKFWAP